MRKGGARSIWLGGLGAGVLLGLGGLPLRALGVGWPPEGLFALLTHWLGLPWVFNLLHKLFGFGDLAKNLAFLGAVGLWLLLHPPLWALLGHRVWAGLGVAFALYSGLGGLFLGKGPEGVKAGVVYTLGLGLLALAFRPQGGGPEDLRRRTGLKLLLLLGLELLLGRGSRAKAQGPVGPGLPPEQTPQKDLYYVSKNPAFLDPDLARRPYRLEVGGLVEEPLALELEAIRSLPALEVNLVLTCISNEVGGPLIGCPRWRGVALRTLLEKAGVKPQARFLVFQAADGYTESLPLSELPPEALLAYAIQDPATGRWEELERKHGYPLRLLLPGRYGMKQPKWLTRIVLSQEEVLGYWAQRGWSREAVVRTMSRIDTPRPGARLQVGQEALLGGIAYAGGRPLEAVEVSTDGGRTWQRARLRPPRSRYAWQIWTLSWKPPAPGEYVLVVRAIEAGGRIQDPTPRDPLPDGATGYHRVRVSAG